MSISLYSKEMREEIEEMIEEHVENCRNKPPVEGEHKLVVKKIIKFLLQTSFVKNYFIF